LQDANLTKPYDAVVIGAGPGGYVCAIKLGQLGLKTALVEKEYLGGVCLNVGCIPSKALIHAGSFYDKLLHHAPELGIECTVKGIDLKKLKLWKDGIVKKLTTGVETLLKANKVEIFRGEARFENPHTLAIKNSKESFQITAKNVVIATGSRSSTIPGFEPDGKHVVTSTEALDLTEAPQKLLVLGGGYIGLELGTFYAKIGSKVTVLEATPNLLSAMDADCVQEVERKLKKQGVEILKESKALSWKKGSKGIEVTYLASQKNQTLTCDKILLTVGRKPNTESLDLAKAGLTLDERGFIPRNHFCQTKVPHIYAIGDVSGGLLLAHKASKEGVVCAEVIAGKKSRFDTTIIPAVVFTDPEIATVGLTKVQAQNAGFDPHEAQFPFAALGKALSASQTEGFVKVVADKKTQKLLGVHIVGAEASALLGEAGLALEMGAVLEDVALTIHAHPTLPEALMEAAEVALGHPIHVILRQKNVATEKVI